MKKIILFFALLGGILPDLMAQKVVFEHDVAKDSILQTFGPNRKNFAHFYLGYGLMAGGAEGKGSTIEYGKSHEFLFGYRYKLRVNNFYALGFDLSLNTQTFNLKQQASKTLPNAVIYDEEKLKFTNFGLGVYNRFNVGKRGNYIGRFLDLGAYGNWTPFKTHIYANELPKTHISGAGKVKVRETGLRYVADTNYGLLARLGFNRTIIYATYRLSDLFGKAHWVQDENGNNTLAEFAELPRITFGLQIGLHK